MKIAHGGFGALLFLLLPFDFRRRTPNLSFGTSAALLLAFWKVRATGCGLSPCGLPAGGA